MKSPIARVFEKINTLFKISGRIAIRHPAKADQLFCEAMISRICCRSSAVISGRDISAATRPTI
jgi:hypothetical protein